MGHLGFQAVGVLAAISHLGKAFIAIHWSITPGLKRNLALLTAVSADCRVHLTGSTKASSSLLQATLLATSGFAL